MITFFKKTITSILLVSFFLVAIPPKAEAEIDATTLGVSLGSAGAQALVGCVGVRGIVSGLKTKIKTNAANKAREKLSPVLQAATPVIVDDTAAKMEKMKKDCMDKVAVALVRVTLQQLTESIVNWINTGYDGNPLYIRNRESFFESLGKSEINSFKTAAIEKFKNDPALSKNPYFKKGIIQLITNAKKTNLDDFTKYQYNGPDAKAFQKSFSEGGGWAAWSSVTLSERNNPLGVSMNLTTDLYKKIEQKTEAVNGELSQQNFLSVKKCVDPSSYEVDKKTNKNAVCDQWEVVTPGSVVQAQINQALANTGHQLDLAGDINSSVSQIFTALTNQLIKKGLRSLSAVLNRPNELSLGGEGDNSSKSGITGFTNGDAADWLKVSPNKPIDPRTFAHEILPDVIITQLSYIGDQTTLDSYYQDSSMPSVKRRVNQLNKIKPGSAKVNYALSLSKYSFDLSDITTDEVGWPLHDLSYCIPGPRPGWEANTDAVIQMKLGGLNNKLLKTFDQSKWDDFWKSMNAQEKVNIIINTMSASYHDAVDLYQTYINNMYVNNPYVMPVTRNANSELEKWPLYTQQIMDNQAEADDVMTTTYQVVSLQKKMDNLMNRIYKRLADESKAKYGYDPKRREQVSNINDLPIDPSCVTALPYGGLFGNTGNITGGGAGSTTGGDSSGGGSYGNPTGLGGNTSGSGAGNRSGTGSGSSSGSSTGGTSGGGSTSNFDR